MYLFFRKIARLFLPTRIRRFLWSCVPVFYKINTLVIENPAFINTLIPIDDNIQIRIIDNNDLPLIKKFYSYRSEAAFKRLIHPRLNAPEFVGLAAIDLKNNEIAYLSWIIINSIPYFEEFGFTLKKGEYLVKDIFVLPKYRHKGLSTRMEQERINYCVKRNDCKRIFTQPLAFNTKGNEAYFKLGYKKIQSNYLIQWPVFNIWRELKSFTKNPFKRVLK